MQCKCIGAAVRVLKTLRHGLSDWERRFPTFNMGGEQHDDGCGVGNGGVERLPRRAPSIGRRTPSSALPSRRRARRARRLSLALLVQKYLLAGTKVQILTPEELLQRMLGAIHACRCSKIAPSSSRNPSGYPPVSPARFSFFSNCPLAPPACLFLWHVCLLG